MPGLVLTGNVIENLGKNFPVPYIERIYLDPSSINEGWFGYALTLVVYIPNPDGAGEQTNDYQTLLIDSLKLSLVVASNMTEEEYDNIITGKTLLWEDYVNNSSTRNAFDWNLSSLGTRTIEYDEEGNEYVAYRTGITVQTTSDVWGPSGLDSLYVFALTGLEGVPSDTEYAEYIKNPELYKQRFSEVAYEKVWVDGTVADRLQLEYYDLNKSIYTKTPLRTIESLYVEDNILTHAEIVEYFQELIDEYQTEYERYPRLAKMIDGVSLIIETYGDDPDLVPQLNKLRKVFPTKSPSNPTGKFYKRFRKRIAATNKRLKESKRLDKRIVRNGKIIDTRQKIDTTYEYPSTNDADGKYYVYNNWYVSRVEDASVEGGAEEIAQQGVFFFDYEKAVRFTSNIAYLLEVSKLKEHGLDINFGMFRITEIKLEREAEGITIKSVMDPSRGYPKTYYSLVEGVSSAMLHPDFGIAFASDEEGYQAASPFAPWYANPALIVRNFYNLSTNGLAGSTIEDYRLLACTFQDFYFRSSGLNENATNAGLYKATVEITDNTLDIINKLATACKEAYTSFRDYAQNANSLGSLNEETLVFNTFFKDGILGTYADDMGSAPWILAPLTYCLHLDLVYNSFGGSQEEILTAAYAIMDRVEPVNGNYAAIANFEETFKSFYQEVYNASNTTSLSYRAESLGLSNDIKRYSNTYDYSTLAVSGWVMPQCEIASDCECGPGERAVCNEGKCICYPEFHAAGETGIWLADSEGHLYKGGNVVGGWSDVTNDPSWLDEDLKMAAAQADQIRFGATGQSPVDKIRDMAIGGASGAGPFVPDSGEEMTGMMDQIGQYKQQQVTHQETTSYSAGVQQTQTQMSQQYGAQQFSQAATQAVDRVDAGNVSWTAMNINTHTFKP